MQDAAQAAGLTVRTGYRWLARREGSAGLRDRSSRARRIRHRTSRLRADRIAAVLKRRGLERLSQLTPEPAVVRHERQRPGDR
jgi:hypothetical protein